jgi:hypothetical protein
MVDSVHSVCFVFVPFVACWSSIALNGRAPAAVKFFATTRRPYCAPTEKRPIYCCAATALIFPRESHAKKYAAFSADGPRSKPMGQTLAKTF